MDANTRIPNELYELAKGLGFIFSESWEGSYWSERLRFAIIDGIEYGIKVDVNEEISIPNQFILFQNYPNPFNSNTTIRFEVPEQSFVEISVYDIKGSKVSMPTIKEFMPGIYKIFFDGSKLSSGVYFYQLKSPKVLLTKKMLLIR